jgi:hypothetical protein
MVETSSEDPAYNGGLLRQGQHRGKSVDESRHDPVTTDPLSIESGEMADLLSAESETVVAIKRRPLAHDE